ncbi:hypothetical protein [Solimonas marina]|uniref:Uncharacterized protein n=1 Tax=Solimonas marina TaxID=2714601 RepID=A0A970B612_9GAMM|nr:hypothetical protein [Solimonas marina]NKF22160.1 hypothetical protein [Solimonas marina]
MPADTATLDRRGFLKLSAGGATTLALLGAGVQLSGCSQRSAAVANGYRWLTASDIHFMRALVAGVAGNALPADPTAAGAIVDEGVRRADIELAALGAPAQQEVRKLLDLLQWTPFRRFAGGVTRPWAEAGAADAQTLLKHLHDSHLSLLSGAYRALAKIGSTVLWSQTPMNAFSHYPGPPAWAISALEA